MNAKYKTKSPIPFRFNSDLACRIANLHTKKIEDLEQVMSGAKTPWQSRFTKPYKANYANDIARRAARIGADPERVMLEKLAEYEVWTREYENNNSQGRPLTHFVRIVDVTEKPAPQNKPEPNKPEPKEPKMNMPEADQVQALVNEATNNKPASNKTEKLAQALADLLASQNNPPKTAPLDEVRVRELAKEEASKINSPKLTLVHVKRETKEGTETKDLGIQHRSFPMLLKLAQLRQPDGYVKPVWLPGPAGSGKTTAAMNVAKALNLPFQHTGALDNAYQLTGFRDANGNVHRTPFREAYEHGGVFLWDEVDASNPAALVAFNAAMENGHCVFPDGLVERHADCIMIAAANTFGMGATHEYVGRNKIDAATVDRFIMLAWKYDEVMERALAGNEAWVDKVQNMRRRCAGAGIKHVISPRASIIGARMLADGFKEWDVIKMVVRKGLSDDQWAKVKGY